MRKVGIIVAVAVLTFALCAAQQPEQTNTAGQKARFTQVRMQGVASAVEARTSPRPPRPVHHARRAFTHSVPASPAPAPIRPTRAPSPPIHSGGLHGLVCSYGWSCTIATCIVNRETGGTWDPHSFNHHGSRAAGLWQWLPMWYEGHFDPFNPYVATAVAWDHYKRWGWRDWSGDGSACGF